MAEQDTDTNAEAGEEQSGGGRSKLIIAGVLLGVLGIGGFFAAPFIKDMISPPSETEEEIAEGENAEDEPADAPALFASLHPALVVNLTDAHGDPHFMQITLEVMARDQDLIDEVKNHTAVIRNSLILLFGTVDYEFVTTREGKEQMLADALIEIQEIIERETGETGIEAVYFTGLIIQ